MRRLPMSILCLLVAAPMSARADWEYTKWGMTPEQVAKASKGAAKVIPPAKRRTGGAVESGATAAQSLGPVKMAVGFLFDAKTHGLVCVISTVDDHSTNAQLESELLKRLGQPRKTSGDPGSMKSLEWVTPADEITLTETSRSPSQVMDCKPGATFY